VASVNSVVIVNMRRLTSRLAALRRLSWPDRWLLLQAGLVVVVVSLSLRVVSFQRAHTVLRRLTPRADGRVEPAGGAASARALDVARLVNVASRHMPLPNTCLHRSLALWWLLERRGYDSRLQFGARKRDGVFEAHAWVEHGGLVISDDQAEHDYAPLPWAPLKNDA
jgi:transglutaminase superfamily protein